MLGTYRRIAALLEGSRSGRQLLPLARRARRALDPRVHEQLARSPSVTTFFHPPSPNNFVDVFVPKARDLEPSLAEMHRITAPLNEADGALLEYFTDLSEKRRDVVTGEIFDALVHWSAARKRRRFLSGVDHAERVIAGFSASMGESIVGRIEREQPQVIDAFCRLPEDLKRVLRINIYLAPKEVCSVVEALVSGSDLRLGRLEVARLSARASRPQSFPTLILYAPRMESSEVEAWLSATRAWLAQALLETTLGDAPAEFADVWQRGCSITEGFRLYKRYLQILGRLDAVYDASRGYAYAL